MNTKQVLFGWVSIVAIFGVSFANGQDWSGGIPYVPAYWGYGYQSIYSTSAVPYYSLHPPVYYSYRVARTYGYSPFAYPPGVLTPSREASRAAMPQNTYATASGETSESQDGHQPLRIDNPFIEHPNRPGVTKSQRPTGRQPQVVYPAALARLGK
jgi:hypothetical protein